MRIPKKQEAQVMAEEGKRQSIDEGMKIAQRVDTLRQELTNLTEQRKNFIEGTKEALQREITPLNVTLEGMRTELKDGREELVRLRQPLDVEWENLRLGQGTLVTSLEEIGLKKIELSNRELLISQKEKENQESFKRIQTLKSEVEDLHSQADKNKVQSELILKASQNKVQATDEEITERLGELKKKENIVEFNRKGNDQITKNQAKKEQELITFEQQLNDKYKTLLQATEEVNGKRTTRRKSSTSSPSSIKG